MSLWLLFVCLSTCISQKPHVQFQPVPWGNGLFRLWRRCDMLCNSGFVKAITFPCTAWNMPESKTTHMFLPVCKVATPAGHQTLFSQDCQVAASGAKSDICDCILLYFLNISDHYLINSNICIVSIMLDSWLSCRYLVVLARWQEKPSPQIPTDHFSEIQQLNLEHIQKLGELNRTQKQWILLAAEHSVLAAKAESAQWHRRDSSMHSGIWRHTDSGILLLLRLLSADCQSHLQVGLLLLL